MEKMCKLTKLLFLTAVLVFFVGCENSIGNDKNELEKEDCFRSTVQSGSAIVHESVLNGDVNIMNLRQTHVGYSGGCFYYSIEWNRYMGATKYAVMKQVRIAGKVQEVKIAETQDLFFIGSCAERLGFCGKEEGPIALKIFVKPIIKDKVVELTRYGITPLLFHSEEHIGDMTGGGNSFINNLDAKCQFTYWHNRYVYPNDNEQVSLFPFGFHLKTNTTNNGPLAHLLVKRDDANNIVVNFKAKIHRSNQNHFFRVSTPFSNIGVYHQEYFNKFGGWGIDKTSLSPLEVKYTDRNLLYDEWSRIYLRFDFRNNTIELIQFDDMGKRIIDIKMNVDFSNNNSEYFPIRIDNFGWHTGHKIEVIDLQYCKY